MMPSRPGAGATVAKCYPPAFGPQEIICEKTSENTRFYLTETKRFDIIISKNGLFMESQVFESLQGMVAKVIFTAKDTGYTVAILDLDKQSSVTLAGHMPNLFEDDEIKVEGKWASHAKYGKQFVVTSYMKILPAQADAIESYLASGMIKGLGPATAAKIVDKFGDKTLEVLSNEPHRLLEIPGIGEIKCQNIARGWREQRGVEDLMVFLSGCGITPAYATRIYRKYGLEAIQVIQNDPYQLCYDIGGIGFLTADRVARKLGFPEDCSPRIKAGTLYALEEGRTGGHVFYPENILRSRAKELLNTDCCDLMDDAINDLETGRSIVIEPGENGIRNIYPANLYNHEVLSASLLTRLGSCSSVFKGRMFDVDEQIEMAEKKFGVTLSEEQKSAVQKACHNTVTVLTGGPGTGKTTTTRVAVEVFMQKGATIKLAAPTGKAAKRLEICGEEASTIHRLLGYNPQQGFQFNEESPLGCDVLIVDEMSMCDISLFYHLLAAIAPGAHLIVIGDADQLPSVGPGLVMRHLVDSRTLPVTFLTQIYRQAEGSGITQVAHAINSGEVPSPAIGGKDCHFRYIEDPKEAANMAIQCALRLRELGRDWQVLTPMHKGEAGTQRLNERLQDAINPIPEGEENTYQAVSGFRKFRLKDRVIQMKNDYDKDVFNGDSGVISFIDQEEQTLGVMFEGRGQVVYDFLDLDQLSLSYCITIHKSQGSEYDTVIMLCLMQHYIMLARNLVYTGISRAKKQAAVIGPQRAMTTAVHNNKPKARYTLLKDRMIRFREEFLAHTPTKQRQATCL